VRVAPRISGNAFSSGFSGKFEGMRVPGWIFCGSASHCVTHAARRREGTLARSGAMKAGFLVGELAGHHVALDATATV